MVDWKRNLTFLWIAQFLSLIGFSFALPFVPFYFQELGVTGRGALRVWTGLVRRGLRDPAGHRGPDLGGPGRPLRAQAHEPAGQPGRRRGAGRHGPGPHARNAHGLPRAAGRVHGHHHGQPDPGGLQHPGKAHRPGRRHHELRGVRGRHSRAAARRPVRGPLRLPAELHHFRAEPAGLLPGHPAVRARGVPAAAAAGFQAGAPAPAPGRPPRRRGPVSCPWSA